MELRHLVYFIAVAEELHFGRAAKRLNISQPPLSQQIKQLEEELSLHLLDRSRRRVTLTPAGEAFLEEARRIIAMTEEAIRRTVRAERGETGYLSVGFIGSANYSVLPQVIRAFRRRYPEVQLFLTEMNTAQQLEALQEGRIHVGFLRPPRGVAGGIEVEPIFREPLVAVVPTYHRLQNRFPLTLHDLAGEPFIMVPRRQGPGYFDYIISLCRLEGFSPFIVLEASQFHTIIGLVAAGLGVSVVPATMRHSRLEGVVFLDLEGRGETVLEMAWKTDGSSRVLRNFLKVAMETADSLQRKK